MNIEKIKNYNQKMLAAFITVIVIASTIGLISLIVLIVSELIPNNRQPSNTLLSDDKVEELKKDSLRQQIISFDSPILVDTLNLTYIIPVTIKNLAEPEKMDDGVLGLLDGDFRKSSRTKYRERRFYSTFNNLIVYDYNSQNSEKISDYRLIGADLSFKYFNDEIIVVFMGAEKDTDHDKNITLYDFKSLFIYSLQDRKLKRIDLENSTVISYEYVENKKDILVRFGYDRNKNSLFESDIEPTFVMRYDSELNNLNHIVNKELENDIQRIIDKE